ncbi:DUF433 domain-containing protein [Thioclava sp.]|uniref:DUF433 domain-containing protein n=1 Tax=Thioclava sp. TaxID=1933450 RepID=UPI003AA81FBB
MRAELNPAWRDRLRLPAYRVGEAASYARISAQTVAAWEKSYTPKRRSVLTVREAGQGLSFLQLIEIAVVAELRRVGLSLEKIRTARAYFCQALNHQTPFATQDFKTDGTDILQEMKSADGKLITDKLVVANASGQLAWTEFLGNQFQEFHYGDGIVVSWKVSGPQSELVIDPQVSFGAPSVRGIMTRAIKSEYAAGSNIDEIAEDYDLPAKLVIEALKFEGLFLGDEVIH